jgi:hypothetical protein
MTPSDKIIAQQFNGRELTVLSVMDEILVQTTIKYALITKRLTSFIHNAHLQVSASPISIMRIGIREEEVPLVRHLLSPLEAESMVMRQNPLERQVVLPSTHKKEE